MLICYTDTETEAKPTTQDAGGGSQPGDGGSPRCLSGDAGASGELPAVSALVGSECLPLRGMHKEREREIMKKETLKRREGKGVREKRGEGKEEGKGGRGKNRGKEGGKGERKK